MEIRNRVAEVDIIRGDQLTRIAGLRVQFRVQRERGSLPTARLLISNPGAQLKGAAADPDVLFAIRAGHETTGVVELMRGRPVVDSVKITRGPDASLDMVLQSSSSPMEIMLAEWMDGPVTVRAALERIASITGLAIDVIADVAGNITMDRGHALQGPPRRLLFELAQSAGCQVAVDDGRLSVWPSGEARTTAVDVWSAATGLMDATETAGGRTVRASCLLRPGLQLGDTVQLDGIGHRGRVALREILHTGDTHSVSAWTTEIVGVPIG